MTDPTDAALEARARELLAAEYERDGWPVDAVQEVRQSQGRLVAPTLAPALLAIVAALRERPLPAQEMREAAIQAVANLCGPGLPDGFNAAFAQAVAAIRSLPTTIEGQGKGGGA